MKRLIPVVLFFAMILSSGLYAQTPGVDLDIKKLEKGDIQVFKEEYSTVGEGKKMRVVGMMLIDAPPAELWDVLVDWDAMGPYVSGLDYYKTVHRIEPVGKDSGQSLIEGKLSIAFFTVLYTLDVRFDRSRFRQEWTMVDKETAETCRKSGIGISDKSGTIKDIQGYEYIEPYGDGSRSMYFYAPIVETAVPLPGFVERAVSKSTLKGYMEGVRKMVAEKKAGKK
ncbi:MAG: hypothetical protein U9P80_02645 [Thermodesulfobacteriota bacterium]|nr:hypothetical protein [Thermodesulfobacteriota bacterium]